ncbi:MAG: MFS transporter [Pseudomonadota bacterium]
MIDTVTETPLRPLSRFQQGMVALASVAMGAGMTINFVVVAPLAREAGLSEIEVAGILTLSTVLYTATIPIWGRLADRFGRKRVMVFSLFAMAGTNMAFLFGLQAALAGVVTGLTTFVLLAFLRVFFGLLSPGLQPASMAAMTDATTSANRAAGLGLLGAAMSFGSILGPAGAAALAPFGALAPLWGSIAFCAVCGIAVGFSLPKTRKGTRDTQTPVPLKSTDPRILPHLLFLFAYFAAVGVVQQTLGWLVEDRYGLEKAESVQAAGAAFAALAAGMILVQFGVVARYKPDPRRILPLGLAMVAAGYIGAVFAGPFAVTCACFFLVGCGAALAVPSANALGSLSVGRPEQGAAAALLSAAPPAGFIIGPLLGAALYMAEDTLPLLISAAAMMSLAVYAVLVTARRPLTPAV